MGGKMTLEIITPDGYVLRGVETDSVNVPTTEGSIGILWNHAPLAAALQTGVLRYRLEDGDRQVAVSGGYIEVVDNVVLVLADAAELDSDIDIARARAALRRAEERLHAQQGTINRARADAALRRSLNRLKVASAKHPRINSDELSKINDR